MKSERHKAECEPASQPANKPLKMRGRQPRSCPTSFIIVTITIFRQYIFNKNVNAESALWVFPKVVGTRHADAGGSIKTVLFWRVITIF